MINKQPLTRTNSVRDFEIVFDCKIKFESYINIMVKLSKHRILLGNNLKILPTYCL